MRRNHFNTLIFDHLGVSLVSTFERLASNGRDIFTRGIKWVDDKGGVLVNSNLG